MSTELSGIARGQARQEFFPWKGNRAELGGAHKIAATSFVNASAEMRDRWARVVVTASQTMVTALMRTSFYHVVAWGMSRSDAERAIGGFSRYVESVVAGKGTITLCLGMTVDTIRAASASGWPPEQASHLLVCMQKQLDMGTSSLSALADAVKRIRVSASIEDVLQRPVSLSVH